MTDDPKYKIVSVDLDERTVVRRNAEIEAHTVARRRD